jgi:tagaturonate reductase
MMAVAPTPILQFGTSRFLLAHADLFISEAMDRDEALGPVTVVQTTGNPASARRIQALADGAAYPVRIRGLKDGKTIDEMRQGRAIARALFAGTDWPAIVSAGIVADVILSNTGDRGYDLDESDDVVRLSEPDRVPVSFPAKLLVLLYARWRARPGRPVSIFPCELVQRNGDKLKAIVLTIARNWKLSSDFLGYIEARCHFANGLVDRIVSEPLEPVGAVAEPYALWAIEAQEGLVLPCRHPSLVVTDNLDRYEHLKLHILNLGHSYLAERWLAGNRPAGETVREIMADPYVRRDLEAVWRDEVVPVFALEGMRNDALRYVDEVRERFLNPYLDHRLADIAGNHTEKKLRRIKPMLDRGHATTPPISQPLLAAALEASHA